MTLNATYLLVALDGQLIHAMFDASSNITLVICYLAEQLVLEVHAYSGTYGVASRIYAKFIGRIGRIQL